MTISINGKSYTLRFNAMVYRDILARFGGFEEFDGFLRKEEADAELFDGIAWLTESMTRAGAALERLEGREAEYITAEELLLVCVPSDIVSLKAAVIMTMSSDGENAVKLKN